MKLSALSLLAVLATAVASPVKRALPRLGGINLAGCEFGMNVWGWAGTPYCPSNTQIDHFVNQGANVVRLPFGWQYMVTDRSSRTLADSYFQQYDALVRATTAKGAYAILDLHNYGRWNSGVVGVDGPSNEEFAALWSLLAAKYANNPRVMFGLMNEPHDQDIAKFAVSCQAAVNAIRAAGAKSQIIILPGNQWDNAGVWASGGNAPMLEITDPAASDKAALLLDVHKYIDGDGSGTSHTCVNNGLDLLKPLVEYLHRAGRKAIMTEIGAAVTPSCLTYFPQMMEYIVDNADVIAGFTVWSAGSFQPYPGYELSIVPNPDGSDNEIWIKGVKPFLPGNSAPSTSAVPSASSSVSSTTKPTTATVSSTVSIETPEPTSSVSASSIASQSSVVTPAFSSTVPAVTSSVRPFTSSAATTSSAGLAPSSVEPPTSSSAIPSSATPSSYTQSSSVVTTSTSTSSPPITTSTTSTGNLQTFTRALGGYTAPPVTKSGNYWYIGTQRYNFLIDALNQSCYKQMDVCQLNANRSGNVEPLTVANCNGAQITECLRVARASSQT